jgi:glycosyltransferase involved in cell wall biosynthesis
MGTLGHVGRWIEGRVARLPGTHMTVSQHTADTLAGLGRRAEAVIPSGVEFARGRPASSTLMPADVLFIGRLVPTKNLGLLIDATDLLVRRRMFPRVLVVGDGPHRAAWQDHVDRLGLNDCIEFAGTVETESEILALFETARVLAATSLREGFGMVPLEASAHGVPVVTVDHPRNAARHLVRDGVTGFVVSPDPGAFADALQALLEDETLRENMSRQSMEMARHATWDAAVDGTEAVYLARVA